MGDGARAQQPVDISTISSIGSLSLTEECKPAIALFDFQGSVTNEISVKAGDVLDVYVMLRAQSLHRKLTRADLNLPVS